MSEACTSSIEARFNNLADRVSAEVLLDAAQDEVARMREASDRFQRLIDALRSQLQDGAK